MARSQQSGCLGIFLKLLGIDSGAGPGSKNQDLSYRVRDNFLSAAELAFYRVLEQAVGQSIADLARLSSKDELAFQYILTATHPYSHDASQQNLSEDHYDRLTFDRIADEKSF